MHHQLGGSTEDDMNKMSVIGHFFLKIIVGDFSSVFRSRQDLKCQVWKNKTVILYGRSETINRCV
jgi:hypothetical protein